MTERIIIIRKEGRASCKHVADIYKFIHSRISATLTNLTFAKQNPRCKNSAPLARISCTISESILFDYESAPEKDGDFNKQPESTQLCTSSDDHTLVMQVWCLFLPVKACRILFYIYMIRL